jgi:O-acetyl-ADP-ribose deacetylase (regulator of RNase III)
MEGGGICGVIFGKAGSKELAAECSKYKTPLKDGEAVITSACKLKNAKAIIHAVGPDFGSTPNSFKELYEAYYNSLVVMMKNGYHSISFPLISSGIFGGDLQNPAGESAKQCYRAYKKFGNDFADYKFDLFLCAFTASEYTAAKKEFDKVFST